MPPDCVPPPKEAMPYPKPKTWKDKGGSLLSAIGIAPYHRGCHSPHRIRILVDCLIQRRFSSRAS